VEIIYVVHCKLYLTITVTCDTYC